MRPSEINRPTLPSIGAVGHQRAIDDQAEPQDRTKAAKVSEHRRRAPIQFMLNKRRVNGPAASKQYLARVRCTAPEWIATILIDKDHVTCRRGIFGEFNHFLRSGRLRVK
jgi:hypothetical protein